MIDVLEATNEDLAIPPSDLDSFDLEPSTSHASFSDPQVRPSEPETYQGDKLPLDEGNLGLTDDSPVKFIDDNFMIDRNHNPRPASSGDEIDEIVVIGERIYNNHS